MMDEITFWLKYPFMIKSEKGTATIYQGTINVNDEDYRISIAMSKGQKFKISLPEKLMLFERDILSAVNNLEQRNIVTVLETLEKIIIAKIPFSVPVNYCDVYTHVLYEYSEFTKFYLNLKSSYLAPDLSKIDVSIMDERNREHFLQIAVNFDDAKRIFKVRASDVPEGKESFKESSSLKVIYDQFLAAVEALQPFFNIIDVFDENCWILDPLEPKRSCTYRRICLGENISVILTVDPYNVNSIPDLRFLGPERLVAAYRDKINENLDHWMYENDIYLEILKLLGMDSFPRKIMDQEKGLDVLKDSGDCSICFSLRLNENLPEVVCKNNNCENHYHTECLYEWLISVNARRFFSEVVGLCPNCEKSISCPIPK